MTSDHPFDSGLQLERTHLAWRRTCLALAVGALVGIRLLASTSGGLAVLVGCLVLVLAAGAYRAAVRRNQKLHRTLSVSQTLGSGGLPHVALASATVSLAVLGLLYLLA